MTRHAERHHPKKKRGGGVLTGYDLVCACCDIYDDSTKWDYRFDLGGVCVGIRHDHFHGCDIVAFRDLKRHQTGLRTCVLSEASSYHRLVPPWILGWHRIRCLGDRQGHHGGRKYVITGHSLGGAHAYILASIFTKIGVKPSLVVTFGCPKPGFGKLSHIIRNGGFPFRSYANEDDPVPEVPISIPFLLPYKKPSADIMLNIPPAKGDDEPLRSHHCSLYVDGIRELLKK